MTTSTPSTPVSTAILASSMWHRMCVRILDLFKPSLQIASQSLRDCSEAAGEVSSMYYRQCQQWSTDDYEPRGSTNVTYIGSELIQCLCNLDLLSSVKVGVGELFSFS